MSKETHVYIRLGDGTMKAIPRTDAPALECGVPDPVGSAAALLASVAIVPLDLDPVPVRVPGPFNVFADLYEKGIVSW